jgi:thiol:disulfide interchange protein
MTDQHPPFPNPTTETAADGPAENFPEQRNPSMLKQLIVGLILVALFSVFVWYSTRTAPTPDLFLQDTSLLEAFDLGDAEGKPVFAVVTADWCGPCQTYKRTALADTAVQDWLSQNTVSVMLDSTSPLSRDDAMLLNDPRSIPMTAMFIDGRMVDAFGGVMDASSLLQWLEQSTDPGSAPEDTLEAR